MLNREISSSVVSRAGEASIILMFGLAVNVAEKVLAVEELM